MDHPKSEFNRKIRTVLIVTLTAGCLILSVGCTSFQDIKRKAVRLSEQTTRKIADLSELKFRQNSEKKKIAIAAITDQTDFRIKQFGDPLQKHLVAQLKKMCSNNMYLSSGDEAYPDILRQLPRHVDGRIDNFALMESARQVGLNTVISGTVIDIRTYTDERGMLWFRDTHKFLQVLVNIEAYDTETGAKLTDESYLYETELDLVEFDDDASTKHDLIPIIDEAIADAATYLADQICYALGSQEWSGYITAVDGTRIEISSGKKMGLSVDQVLSVYDVGTLIQGIGEERFFQPGGKIGEIRITEAGEDRSTAVSVSGETVPAGSVVKLK